MATQKEAIAFIDYLRQNFNLATNKVGDSRVPIFKSYRCLPTNGTTKLPLEVPGPSANSGRNQVIQIEAGARVRIVTQSESYGLGYYGASCIQGVYIQKGKWQYNFV